MNNPLFDVSAKYGEYPPQAYALIFQTMEWVRKKEDGDEEKVAHLTGQELGKAIFDFSVDMYGFLTPIVWQDLNIYRSEDIGKIVWHLVQERLIGKRDEDKIEDFDELWSIDDFTQLQMRVEGWHKDQLRIEYVLGDAHGS